MIFVHCVCTEHFVDCGDQTKVHVSLRCDDWPDCKQTHADELNCKQFFVSIFFVPIIFGFISIIFEFNRDRHICQFIFWLGLLLFPFSVVFISAFLSFSVSQMHLYSSFPLVCTSKSGFFYFCYFVCAAQSKTVVRIRCHAFE